MHVNSSGTVSFDTKYVTFTASGSASELQINFADYRRLTIRAYSQGTISVFITPQQKQQW